VNDAFGCCHRSHMSIVGMNKKVPHAYGYLIDKELKCLELINKNKNQDKILAIIGGGKMTDKLELLKNLSKKVDGIYIAGGNINSLCFDKSNLIIFNLIINY
jgi:phosphoglycerate kinase